MSVTVLVPWKGGCRHREDAWAWVRSRYEAHHPDWNVIRSQAPLGPWIKADAVMPALEQTNADVVIVADADVWCYGLSAAVRAVVCGVAAWAVPHGKTHRLTPEETERVLAGTEPGPEMETVWSPYEGVSGGGLVVARPETLLDVPLDPRFVGWGQEDGSWGVALQTLHGDRWRGEKPLFHLWHPAMPRRSRRVGSRENFRLRRRYAAASKDPDLMRALLSEVSDAPSELPDSPRDDLAAA